MNTSSIELLAPAGNSEALAAAVGEGADAVYMGLKDFNARLRSANFAYSQFEGALRTVRKLQRKIYVTVNTVFTERETDRVYQLLKYLAAIVPDGIIVQDFGVLKMARESFPNLKLHSSTQMNIASSRACNVLSKQGVTRVVLARELALDEIKTIRSKTNVELEIFTHGALCVSASGLCLFSSFLGGKSANRGMCTQACRRLYSANETKGYYFSPFDLQLIEHLPEVANAGINAIKIEGRMKSAEYVGAVVRAYRKVIDAIAEHGELRMEDGFSHQDDYPLKIKETIQDALQILQNDFARGKTIFHFEENTPSTYLKPEQDGGTGIKLGAIIKVKNTESKRLALVECSGTIVSLGDSIRLHKSDDSVRKTHKLTLVTEEREQGLQGEGLVPQVLLPKYWLDIPDGFDVEDNVYLVQTKSFSHHWAPVVPKDLSLFKRQPGRDCAPARMPRVVKKSIFPDGLYVSVGHIEDFYVAQSIKPDYIILALNQKNVRALINNKNTLPFNSKEIILNFDPFYNEAMDGRTAEHIEKLITCGYKNYIVNNLAHISLLSSMRKELRLIAGPYLYTFNKYASEFICDLGMDSIITPFENSRQNLEKTFGEKERSSVFITVFSYPALFRIQSDLSGMYQFNQFKDSQDAEFRLVRNADDTLVLPEAPFSIVDKIPFLQATRFKRFILDFSPFALRKKMYKEIVHCAKAAAPVPNATRFNWKNGFYSNEKT
jgi:putative protease